MKFTVPILALVLCSPAGLRAQTPAPDTIVVTASLRSPFAAKPVETAALATMRGGVLLPNGLDISIGIDIQTRVDGMLVLHTIYASDGPDAGTRVFTNGMDQSAPVPASVSVTTPAETVGPAISVTRSPGGTSIAPGTQTGPTTVNVIEDPADNWVPASGQQEVPVSPDGPPVSTELGEFSLSTGENGVIATLQTPDLAIRQLIGRATGVVVANSGNDRTIDTVSAVNVELRGAEALLAQAQFISSALAREIVRGR